MRKGRYILNTGEAGNLVLSWMNRDGWLILVSRGVRSFGYGLLSAAMFIYLGKVVGFSDLMVTVILSATLLGSAGFTVFVSYYADRLGRKRLLIVLSVLMAVSGLTFALTTNFYILFAAAIVGTLSPTGAEIGSFLPMEQAILPQTVAENRRTSAFAAYNIVGYLAAAFGGLAYGIVDVLESANYTSMEAHRVVFVLYAIFAGTVVMLYLSLSAKAEMASVRGASSRHKMSRPTRKVVARLSGLFAIDAFAGGFVLQTYILFWFSKTYGVSATTVGALAFVAGLLTTLSMYAAVWLSERIGLLRTMVFTHIPSSVFLILIPVASTFPLSMAFFFARQAISQMDVPTRQSYTVAIVAPEERTAAAGMTAIARNVSQAASPPVSGAYVIPAISLSAPFFLGGILKIIFDISVYFNFRHIRPPEEVARERRQAEKSSRGG